MPSPITLSIEGTTLRVEIPDDWTLKDLAFAEMVMRVEIEKRLRDAQSLVVKPGSPLRSVPPSDRAS